MHTSKIKENYTYKIISSATNSWEGDLVNWTKILVFLLWYPVSQRNLTLHQVSYVGVMLPCYIYNQLKHVYVLHLNMSRLVTKPTMWLCAQRRLRSAQISLGIRPVWSEYSLSAQWVAKDPSFLHADNEDSDDQTGRMPRLIWVFAGRTLTLLVLSRGGSYHISYMYRLNIIPMQFFIQHYLNNLVRIMAPSLNLCIT